MPEGQLVVPSFLAAFFLMCRARWAPVLFRLGSPNQSYPELPSLWTGNHYLHPPVTPAAAALRPCRGLDEDAWGGLLGMGPLMVITGGLNALLNAPLPMPPTQNGRGGVGRGSPAAYVSGVRSRRAASVFICL